MPELSLEELVEERDFTEMLASHSEEVFRLGNTLLTRADQPWNKRHYFQLVMAADTLESYLDDFGARLNRTFCFFGELVASLRGFASAGYSVTHLSGRLDSYGVLRHFDAQGSAALQASVERVERFLREAIRTMLRALFDEAYDLGVSVTSSAWPEESFAPVLARQRLPRNLDLGEIHDERQKIAEVSSKYLQTHQVLARLRIHPIEDAAVRARFLSDVCTEERARVYEAMVHNLQSAYDTYIKNTVLEAEDERLPQLRGFVSTALHLLEATTYLTHFYERHEDDIRSEAAKERIARLIDRADVQAILLNELLTWADRSMTCGRDLAHELLPRYTNAQELHVELTDDLVLHARPAALIVEIVNRYGTPVEMEVGKHRCNAASILELLVTVGSHPDEKRFVFLGDERPLRDIGVLFQYGLGESGVDTLPDELAYLRK